jgi:murein DD-endopeptidase MepM/ murein hydrolase activator NlpD
MVSLSLDPPPSFREGRKPPRSGRRVALVILVLVAGGAGFLAGRWTAPGGRFATSGSSVLGHPLATAPAAPAPATTATPAPATTAATAQPALPAAAPEAGALPRPGAVEAPGQPGSAAPPAVVPARVEAPSAPAGARRIAVSLDGPLEEAVGAALPAADRAMASELTQVVNRLLVWNLQVSRDGRKGDKLEVVYSPPAGGTEPGAQEPVVEALRYQSQKLATTIAAYRWKAPGARWARYYRPDGSELEERLVDSPSPDYDQITSLLRDGRRHKGVDFRVPVGSPVLATFDGVIERRNWNWAGNGNCLDIRDPATGRHAIFLHLDVLPKEMAPGHRVKKGERIASSGNSGHSFAPHLHYQLEDGNQNVLDPFEVQPVRRAALDPAARPAFEAERARLDAALAGGTMAAKASGSTGAGTQ